MNLAGAVVMAVATFGLTVAVTRGLTKSEAGVFFSATSLFLIATSIGQLGTDTGLVYFISRCRALGTPELIKSYLRAAVRPVLVTAVVTGGAIFTTAPQLAEVTNPEHVEQATAYLRILAVFIPLAGLENVALAATRGLGTMRPNAIIEQLGRPTLQLLLVVLVVLVPATDLIGWAWGFAYAPAAVVAWIWWRRLHTRFSTGTVSASQPSKAGEFWRFSGPRSLASLAQLSMQRLDIVLVGALAGATEAAVYAAATRFIVAGQMGRNAVSLAIQPQLAEALARRDHAGANHLFQTSAAWLMSVTWPLFLTFALFGSSILEIFGGGYGAGTAVLLLLSLSMLVATGCGDVDTVLIMAGRTSWSLGNMLLALAVNLGLDLWLIPGYGVLGAAIGWAAAIVTKNVAALIQVTIALRLHPFGNATACIGLLSLVTFAAVPALARLTLGTTWIALLVGLAVGTTCYATALWFLRKTLELDSLLSVRRGRARG